MRGRRCRRAAIVLADRELAGFEFVTVVSCELTYRQERGTYQRILGGGSRRAKNSTSSAS